MKSEVQSIVAIAVALSVLYFGAIMLLNELAKMEY